MFGCSMRLDSLSVSCKISVASRSHPEMVDVLGMTSFAMSVPYLFIIIVSMSRVSSMMIILLSY